MKPHPLRGLFQALAGDEFEVLVPYIREREMHQLAVECGASEPAASVEKPVSQPDPPPVENASSIRAVASQPEPVDPKYDLSHNLPKNTRVGGSDDIAGLASEAAATKSVQKHSIRYAGVDPVAAGKIKNATGLDVDGYRHSIDNFAVRHAIGTHGDKKIEDGRGQQAIEPEDFAKIPDIVQNYDEVQNAGKDSTGNDLIRYRKRYNGSTYYVEEVRTKRAELAAKTLWKTRTANDAAKPPADLNARDDSRNIPQTTERVAAPAEDSKAEESRDGKDGPVRDFGNQNSRGQGQPTDATSDPVQARAELVRDLGEGVVSTLESSGQVEIHADESVLPEEARGTGVRGWFSDGVAHLFPQNILVGNVASVLLHEAGVHGTTVEDADNGVITQALGLTGQEALRRFDRLRRRGSRRDREIAERALEMATEEVVQLRAEGVAVGAERLQSEALAYLVELSSERPQGLSAAMRKFIADLAAALKAFALRSPIALALPPRVRRKLSEDWSATDFVRAARQQVRIAAAIETGESASSRGESSPEGVRSPAPPADSTERLAQTVDGVKSGVLDDAFSRSGANRTADERDRGRQRVVVDRAGAVVPLFGQDGADRPARRGEVVLQRGVGRDEWTVLSQGDDVREGDIARARAAAERAPAAFSRQRKPQTETVAFKRWFGDWDAHSRQAKSRRLIDRAFSEPQWQERTVLQAGDVDPSGKLSTALGEPINKHVITPDDVRKTLKRHGVGRESKPGQIGLTTDDIVAAIEMLRDPCTVRVTRSSNGKPSLEVSRTFSDGTLFVAEVTVAEPGTISFKSAWKKAPAGNNASGLVRTPEDTGGSGESVRSSSLLVNPDAVSKVVDADGKPLVVYHGTASTDITEFLPADDGNGQNTERSRKLVDWFRKQKAENGRVGYMSFRSGTFFSPDPAHAGNYTGEAGGAIRREPPTLREP